MVASLTLLSLFTGAGGMDLGLEHAGFDPLLCIENDPTARMTLTSNRPHWPLANDGDIHLAGASLSPRDFGLSPSDLDLIAGGPPCQPFSSAAQWAERGRRGMDDPRARTLEPLLALIERFLPKVVLLENVRGFVEGPAAALPSIRAAISAINRRHDTDYVMEFKRINAADYGVPQNRLRVIVVIYREGVQWAWPAATHTSTPVTAWSAIGELNQCKVPAPQGKWAELLPAIPEGWNYQWLTSRGGGEELFGYRTKFWNFLLKLARGLPAWTLPASPGPSSGPFHWDSRPLTTLERLRLQSFPYDWIMSGDWRAQTLQTGNAMPPLLAAHFGGAVATSLGREPKMGYLDALSISHGPVPINAPPVLPVPPQFWHLIGSKAAHPGSGLGPAPRLNPMIAVTRSGVVEPIGTGGHHGP